MKPHYCRANSISNIEAGTRMRLSLERLVAGGAGLRAFRVAAATWGLTAGYAKAWDTVFVGSLAEMTGMDERAARRGLKECVDLGALEWRPSQWMGKPSLVGLPLESTPGRSDPESPIHPVYSGSYSGSLRPPNLEPGTQDPDGSTNNGPHGPCEDCGATADTHNFGADLCFVCAQKRWEDSSR